MPDLDSSVAGYRVHYGSSSGHYTTIADAWTNLTISVNGLAPGQTYFFAVAAYNAAGIEGPLSGEVAIVVSATLSSQPSAPQISMVSPGSARPGTQLLLYGTNFTTTTTVQFGGVRASFVVASDGLLSVTVPASASTGVLTVLAKTGTASVQFGILPLVPPANDNFANAQTLSGSAATAFANTLGAGKEPNEPNHAGNTGGSSIWYRWTAPADGVWSLDASGSTFGTLLAVYSGATLGGISVVASNQTAAGYANSLTFNASHGAVYDIAVDGINGASGDVALQLAPVPAAVTVLSSGFESLEGFLTGLTMSGQNGWVCTAPGACGIVNNLLSILGGQQAYIGFPSNAIASNPVLLYHPLNYSIDTNGHPIIQFSVMLQMNDFLDLNHDSFGWAVRNASGQQLFNIIFDNSVREISYGLDNAAGPVLTGIYYDNTTIYTLVVTMDFSRNRWNATINGGVLASGQPLTTTGAALTLGDIDATASFLNLAHPGLDAMVFDNFAVTAVPSSLPEIWSSSGNQSVTSGTDVSLGVAATGAAPLSYQWFFNTTAIPNAISPTLVLKNTTPAQSGVYSVTVSNPNGSGTAQSTVTISSPPPKAILSKPVNWAGQAVLNLTLASGNDYRLQASTNLANWTTISAFHAYGTNAIGCDPKSSQFSQRFYRVVSP
jgi:hypothetical protein